MSAESSCEGKGNVFPRDCEKKEEEEELSVSQVRNATKYLIREFADSFSSSRARNELDQV